MDELRQKVLHILPDIRRFAISLAGNRFDGDDLLQATVERVLSKGVPENADLKYWMFRVARNKWIDEIRSKKVRLDAASKEIVTMKEPVDSESQMIDRITLASIIQKIQNLPEDQRIVLTLVAIEGYSYRAVSELLEIPIGTVMSRVSRARKALADGLDTIQTDNVVPLNITKSSL